MIGLIVSILSAIIPLLASWFKKSQPAASREEARAWVAGFLSELFSQLNAHGVIPLLFQGLEAPVESLFAAQIDAALDKIGW
jgi:hypothetical protein